jgi:RTX calcium-binding nonapeptide repeat (4 copies)
MIDTLSSAAKLSTLDIPRGEAISVKPISTVTIDPSAARLVIPSFAGITPELVSDLVPMMPIAAKMDFTTKSSLTPVATVFPVATTNYFGTNGDDYENYNGPYNLVAHGFAGNDFIWGGNGKDLIYGGDGNDTLKGWYGNDYIDGGNGNDYINGEYGDDTLDGGEGNDSVYGGDGNDVLYGWNGNDYLSGDAGNDRLYGESGNDSLVGGFGNDSLYGGEGNDRLNGYGFTVNNDSQFDNLYGGKGADTFVLGGASGVYYNETGDGYAVIKDFDYREGDKFEVKGNASQYRLEYKSVAGIGSAAMDTEIYYGNDRIAIVEDKSGNEVLKQFDFNFV